MQATEILTLSNYFLNAKHSLDIAHNCLENRIVHFLRKTNSFLSKTHFRHYTVAIGRKDGTATIETMMLEHRYFRRSTSRKNFLFGIATEFSQASVYSPVFFISLHTPNQPILFYGRKFCSALVHNWIKNMLPIFIGSLNFTVKKGICNLCKHFKIWSK